eukprot:tig00000821_g4500.t1
MACCAWGLKVIAPIVDFVFRLIVRLFFRDTEVVGLENIPKDGNPVILAVNHINGLVDALFLYSAVNRHVHFIAKDTLFRVPILGWFVEGCGAIPIKRRLDYEGKEQNNDWSFSEIYKSLRQGKCIAIFPEGISHDKSELQPFKTGCARIALGTMVDERKSPSNPPSPTALGLKIVPCGLTYIRGHRFRAQGVLLIGKPVDLPPTLVDAYEREPRKVVAELTTELERRVRALTINAPDWPTLNFVHTVRRLFQPEGCFLTLEEYVALTRSLLSMYAAAEKEPETIHLRKDVEEYQGKLDSMAIRDHHVKWKRLGFWRGLWVFCRRTAYLLLLLPFALPGIVLNAPAALGARFFGNWFGKAEGVDVVATYKILSGCVLGPVLHLTYVTLVFLFIRPLWWGAVVFAALPVLTYATVRITDECKAVYRSWRVLTRIAFYSQQVMRLRTDRALLVSRVCRWIDLRANERFRTLFASFMGPSIVDHEQRQKHSHDWLLERSQSVIFMKRQGQPVAAKDLQALRTFTLAPASPGRFPSAYVRMDS